MKIISGKEHRFSASNHTAIEGKPAGPASASYVRFEGPTRLLYRGKEIPGQGFERHASGFSSPYGPLAVKQGQKTSAIKSWESLDEGDLKKMGLVAGSEVILAYADNISVTGKIQQILFSEEGVPYLITLEPGKVMQGPKMLYDPAWGPYDMLLLDSLDEIKPL